MTPTRPAPPRARRRPNPPRPAERTLVSPLTLAGTRGRLTYRLVLVTVVASATVVFLGPMLLAVTGALKPPAELVRTPPTLLPREWRFSTYTEAWGILDLGHFMWNTFVVVGGAWLFQLGVAVPAAYSLSKLRPVLGRALLGMMLATLMLPAAALLIPTYLTVADVPLLGLNLLNTPWAIWLPLGANAFNVFVLKRFFDQIPADLLEAARLDGAGPVQVMLRIVLPLSRPILAVVSILAVVAAWKDFVWPLVVLQDPQVQTITVYLARISTDMPLNTLIAGMVISSLPVVALFLLFQRQIIAGLSAGALKG
ncbi:carbohydrate ABC transporter permease [Nocardiopsis deserti]|uniref:carbohydrate ABC transporter permease n=1 Tax=Nocardiopsis deserti TaxID=2605988 RepID=UPI0012388913|nr:carbohydrate ABC transporter permease [Nocardiopsis deserti]